MKNGISIVVHNYMGIPLLAKVMLHMGSFSMEYGEFMGIIEEYVVGSSLDDLKMTHFYATTTSFPIETTSPSD